MVEGGDGNCGGEQLLGEVLGGAAGGGMDDQRLGGKMGSEMVALGSQGGGWAAVG